MQSRFWSAAKAALEKERSPAAMSDKNKKKLQTAMVDQKYLPWNQFFFN